MTENPNIISLTKFQGNVPHHLARIHDKLQPLWIQSGKKTAVLLSAELYSTLAAAMEHLATSAAIQASLDDPRPSLEHAAVTGYFRQKRRARKPQKK
jgi:PHD/YefM family antitoxin component YafN of YafNO toxin-antitoxin module